MKRWLKRGLLALLGVVLIGGGVIGWTRWTFTSRLTEVAASPEAGFSWPYYLYIPDSAKERAEAGGTVRLLVLPNNTGRPDDDFAVHHRWAWCPICSAAFHRALLLPVSDRSSSGRSRIRWSIGDGSAATNRVTR